MALFGTGEAAEVAYLTLRELGLEPIGVFAREPGGQFLGFPVLALADLTEADADAVIVATFDRPEPVLVELIAAGLSRDRIVTLRQPAPPARTEVRP